eukprot:4673217-Pyramimonas_sp.AAC.1
MSTAITATTTTPTTATIPIASGTTTTIPTTAAVPTVHYHAFPLVFSSQSSSSVGHSVTTG